EETPYDITNHLGATALHSLDWLGTVQPVDGKTGGRVLHRGLRPALPRACCPRAGHRPTRIELATLHNFYKGCCRPDAADAGDCNSARSRRPVQCWSERFWGSAL